ncbi:MAG: hypothetical protein U0796_06575 [Gemmatales bacterium]
MYYRMGCPRCNRRIEYTDIQVGHIAYCKKCNQEVVLRGNPVRVSLSIILVIGVAIASYAGMKYYKWAEKQGRYSQAIPAAMQVKQTA